MGISLVFTGKWSNYIKHSYLIQVHCDWYFIPAFRHRLRSCYCWDPFLFWRCQLGNIDFMLRCVAWLGRWVVCSHLRSKEKFYRPEINQFYCDILIIANTLSNWTNLCVSILTGGWMNDYSIDNLNAAIFYWIVWWDYFYILAMHIWYIWWSYNEVETQSGLWSLM